MILLIIFLLICTIYKCVTNLPGQASKPEHACIILWDTKTWKKLCTLSGASLTVTQLAFSHSGHYLLAVSRDRTWSLYQQTDDKGGGLALVEM